MRFINRPRIFYGWYIVAAGTLLITYTAWAIYFGFTAFVTPIAVTTGWSYVQLSLAMSILGVEAGALNPLMGMAVDRFPARRLVLVGVVIFGFGLFFISQVTTIATFYMSFLLIGLGSSLAMQMVPMTATARWFSRDIGKASGILALGYGAGGTLIPLLVNMIDTYGWQNALIILAIGVWVLGIPLSFIFRNRPEDYGLLPDGKAPDKVTESGGIEMQDFSTSVKEALRMRAFWYIGITSMVQIMAMNAVVIHIMPYLSSLGIERSTASQMTMLLAFVSLVTRLPAGLLSDIWQKKHVMALSTGLLGIGSFLFWLIDGSSITMVVLSAIIFGVGMGGFQPLRIPIVREYFGTRNFGVILGLASIFVTIGSIVAPPFAGWVYDSLGTYGPAWLVLSGAAMVGVLIILALPRASHRVSPQEPTTLSAITPGR